MSNKINIPHRLYIVLNGCTLILDGLLQIFSLGFFVGKITLKLAVWYIKNSTK